MSCHWSAMDNSFPRFPETFKASLLARFETITALVLSGVTMIPIRQIASCAALKSLTIKDSFVDEWRHSAHTTSTSDKPLVCRLEQLHIDNPSYIAPLIPRLADGQHPLKVFRITSSKIPFWMILKLLRGAQESLIYLDIEDLVDCPALSGEIISPSPAQSS
ncbi:hypothetical protein H0H87_001055 [Tephrocybe sp. NHM501043]|nr:hypothetical protein H0H87_001055 [Tephrocybe sp. NHM501043]